MKKVVALLAGAALLVTGCGSGSSGSSGTEARTLTVFAAASLTESFGALKSRFEDQHPGVTVTYSFLGSSQLVQQLVNGAKADVFASADQANMDKAVQGGVIDGTPAVFATNRLTIATAPGNPKGVRSFADLARPGLKVVVCAAQVPCGSATKKVEQKTGATLHAVSEEQDVKQVLAKVESGDADAGLVYVTDAASAGDKVARTDFPEAAQAINSYPIAVVRNAPQADLAHQFEQFVLGPEGQQALNKAGFAPAAG
ncbi:molybdate ABC transporter substrate-binding protein [Amycolatopsis cynarae]|uniref:Molybdate ABC transporter substrate-binding protein n=1 Tax=Amycolatopsis cynarae TaxID=2995223 RepID=A0ABY7B4Y6_9PSEU|nr:molybdate ABC transporter substrate-binding protein [Amycolatopsis sp. HUAS 11-8]WAL66283.1 molybdate ABC transporter substrate-binding protein [Amycolatopsis sp. HUAS 11-8]